MQQGFITVAAAIPQVRVADVDFNIKEIARLVDEAEQQGVEILTFPELAVTGYTCQDLFRQQLLLQKAEAAVQWLLHETESKDLIYVIGVPIVASNLLLNSAVVIQHGAILGVVVKEYLPNYAEFYEKRWFASSRDIRETISLEYAQQSITLSASAPLFVTAEGVRFGIELCEDVWSPCPPSNYLTLRGADLVFNLSASDDLIGKHAYLKSLLSQQSARTIAGYVYSSCGFGESTQDVVYGGNAFIYENGQLLAEAKRFSLEAQLIVSQIDIDRLRADRQASTTFAAAQASTPTCPNVLISAHPTQYRKVTSQPFLRTVNPHPFIPSSGEMSATCEEILSIQTAGLAKRLAHTHATHVIIGISGGLDSTLALLVCVRTFDYLGLDRKGIVGVTMPGFGTTDRTYQNALGLMEELGITIREINIAQSVRQHFSDIGQDETIHDVTYENSQARERTQILMDLSNWYKGLVIGTGDLSELALGWCTYNGDHMSMYGVNVSIPKTLIRYLVEYYAQESNERLATFLRDVIDTPVSPELTPADANGNIAQKTEDLVGPYELHDFFLYYHLRFGFRPAKVFFLAKQAFKDKYAPDVIVHWLHTFYWRFFSQQFKRSCLPDGPKVGSVSLSPRGDWRMPSDAMAQLWIDETDHLLD